MSNETELLRELGAALPDGAILTDSDVVESYRQDWSMDPDAGRPLAVVRARTEDDVGAVLRFASERRIPVVPRGAGSSVLGGSTAIDGAITLSVEKLNDLDIDPETRTVVVGPGVINAELSTAAAERGMFYPPNPTSVLRLLLDRRQRGDELRRPERLQIRFDGRLRDRPAGRARRQLRRRVRRAYAQGDDRSPADEAVHRRRGARSA